jgi:Fe-S cluster assembly protein SufB
MLSPDVRNLSAPVMLCGEENVEGDHALSSGRLDEKILFYLMSRGLSEEDATTMVVSGFIEPLVKELPMEYAVEMNRLIQLQMVDSVG